MPTYTYNGSFRQQIRNYGSNTPWPTLRAASGTIFGTPSVSDQVLAGTNLNGYDYMDRTRIGFNTANLAALIVGKYIASATVQLKVGQQSNLLLMSEYDGGWTLLEANPKRLMVQPPDTHDLSNIVFTMIANQFNFSDTGVLTFTLNPYGIAAINPGGTTAFILMLTVDAVNDTPPWIRIKNTYKQMDETYNGGTAALLTVVVSDIPLPKNYALGGGAGARRKRLLTMRKSKESNTDVF